MIDHRELLERLAAHEVWQEANALLIDCGTCISELVVRSVSAEAALADIQTQVQEADKHCARKWSETVGQRDGLLTACEKLVAVYDANKTYNHTHGFGYEREITDDDIDLIRDAITRAKDRT
jgi:hypothetical protein